MMFGAMKTLILGLMATLGLSISGAASAQVYSSVAFDAYGHVGGATALSPTWADYNALTYCRAATCRVQYRFIGPRFIAIAQGGNGVGVGDSIWSQAQAEQNALFYCRPTYPGQPCWIVLSWFAH